MRSMTGYGYKEIEEENKKVIVEMKSVNHRYNDIFVKMPKYLNAFESKIKKLVREKIKRGKTEIYIKIENFETDDVEIKVDLCLSEAYRKAISQISEKLELEDKISVENIINFQDIIKLEKNDPDEELLWPLIEKATISSIDSLIEMRDREGKELKKDILVKIDHIDNLISNIEDRSPKIVLEYKEKLRERINELLEDKIELDESKFVNEVAYFADKINIDEEIVRFKSHLIQLKSTVDNLDAIGKKLDFIIQEINRETNTIGSKISDIEALNLIVEIKSEIEKIREQVQNIE